MTTTGSSSKKRTKRIPFPQRLFNLLKLAEENGWEEIISWVDEGKGFKVHDREKFETLLLAKYFKTPRYASFTRQLHAYDFDCIRTGRQTGIYSHPGFTRDNPEGSCSLQREASKLNSKKARSVVSKNKNMLPVPNFQLGIRAGDTIVQFPSLLRPAIQDDEKTLTSTSDTSRSSNQSSLVTGLYNTLHSQVAEKTRWALIRIPPQAPDNPFNNPDNAFWSLSASQFQTVSGAISPAAVMSPTQQQQNHPSSTISNSMPINANVNIIAPATHLPDVSKADGMNNIDFGAFEPLPLGAEEDGGEDDGISQLGDLDPIPWSPEQSSPGDDDDDDDNDDDDDEGHVMPMDHLNQPLLMDTILEPRPIENMVQNPDDGVNEWWYDSAPMFGTPRKRAVLEFSLPFSLPLGFYLLDVSKFGLCWVIFLVSGHFVECLFTAWGGGNDKKDKTYTKDLCISPALGMLQHHIMDLLWFHYLLSNMMLTPEYFGPPCFPLLYLFMWPQPINLAIVIKTHYCESNLEGTYVHEKYWMGDLFKKSVSGYALTMLGVFFMDVFEMTYLRIPLVFGFNMIPLLVFESYRCMLSVSVVNGMSTINDKQLRYRLMDTLFIENNASRTRGQPIVKEMDEQTSQVKLAAAGFLSFSFILGYGGSKLMIDILGFLYPAYMSLQCDPVVIAPEDAVQWITYWLVYATLYMVEGLFPIIFNHIPYYFSAKMGFMIWLCHPETMGARAIYDQILRPMTDKKVVRGKSA